MGRDPVADQGVVAADDRQPAPVADALVELGRALDVAEHDRDRSVLRRARGDVGPLPRDLVLDGGDRRGAGGPPRRALRFELEPQNRLRDAMHPEARGGARAFVEERYRAAAVLAPASGEERARQVARAVWGGPGLGARRSGHGERVLEALDGERALGSRAREQAPTAARRGPRRRTGVRRGGAYRTGPSGRRRRAPRPGRRAA